VFLIMYRQVSPSENGFAGKPDRMKSSLYEKQGRACICFRLGLQ